METLGSYLKNILQHANNDHSKSLFGFSVFNSVQIMQPFHASTLLWLFIRTRERLILGKHWERKVPQDLAKWSIWLVIINNVMQSHEGLLTHCFLTWLRFCTWLYPSELWPNRSISVSCLPWGRPNESEIFHSQGKFLGKEREKPCTQAWVDTEEARRME